MKCETIKHRGNRALNRANRLPWFWFNRKNKGYHDNMPLRARTAPLPDSVGLASRDFHLLFSNLTCMAQLNFERTRDFIAGFDFKPRE
jgi:hypothetical protein